MLPVGDLFGAGHLFCHIAVKVLGQVHHAVVIRVGLVQLHQRELRVMPRVESLVAEDAPDLVDALHPADNQALQIKLERNPQAQVLVERVKMRLKRPCGRAAGVRHQHRRLHLHKALSVQISADRADHLRTFYKCLPRFLVHDQIHIPLAVARVGIGQAVELLRKNLQAFGEQRELGRVNGDLAGLGLKDRPLHSEDIADIIFFKILIGLLADTVPRHIDLDAPFQILHIAEGRLAHDALKHHTACDGHFRVLKLFKTLADLRRMMRHIIAGDHKRVLSVLLQLMQLVVAHL